MTHIHSKTQRFGMFKLIPLSTHEKGQEKIEKGFCSRGANVKVHDARVHSIDSCDKICLRFSFCVRRKIIVSCYFRVEICIKIWRRLIWTKSSNLLWTLMPRFYARSLHLFSSLLLLLSISNIHLKIIHENVAWHVCVLYFWSCWKLW